MTSLRNEQDWYQEELKRVLRARGEEDVSRSLTVFLSNPEDHYEIDGIISGHLWPAVAEAFANSKLIPRGVPKDFPANLEDRWAPLTTRQAVFVVEDPRRPHNPGNSPMWFVRGTIESTVFNYTLSLDLILSFPREFDRSKLLRLITHPDLYEFSPELSYSHASSEDYFDVKIESGHGAGWLLKTSRDAANHIKSTLIRTLQVIRAADRLERDFSNELMFESLLASVVELFQIDSSGDIEAVGLN